MKIIRPPKGKRFSSSWFCEYKTASRLIKAQLELKRFKQEQAQEVREAVAKHKERLEHRLSMMPDDAVKFTHAYKAAPRLMRQKFITAPYMQAGRVLKMQQDTAKEKERLSLLAEEEFNPQARVADQPENDEFYVPEEVPDLFDKFD